ncbi:divalent metal cation transporter MntH [Desulfosporosinus acididurans]|uniref:Divalent metal cation transporter MntH n=1 Tax=Desulfosporosinus acididurans TaxID=476652 RepID=A0A0J1ISK3_9FIRM|nr:divalent metal cation transporter [Desulfosporosinus acididurans]KLU67636.1 divalent metal cation transporter MntH [Desulfosporosinus acididurans]
MADEQTLNIEKISPSNSSGIKRLVLLLATIGPGLTVMLADTDAGSIITAAQSGAQWGYKLLTLQILLIPILYFVQELTIRIGITTRRGHGELIQETFGTKWAWVSIGTLFLAALGALVTEFSGIAGISALFGVPQWVTVPFVALILILISSTGNYKVVERIAILVGLFELAFVPAALYAKPNYYSMMHAIVGNQPLNNHSYWLLVAANVGAVIMPWMIFYQQGAVVDKGLSSKVIKYSRIDTAVGSVVTQIIMGCVLILTASTIGRVNPNTPLENVQQIAAALTPFLGTITGKTLFAVGLTGAALIAAIVVSLASSWAFGEVLKVPCSLNNTWKEAPAFYGFYCATIVLASIITLVGIPLISLTIAIEVMNTLLLPIVMGLLLALGWRVLPHPYQLRRWEKCILLFIYIVVCSLGLYTLIQLFL